jgi:hypothetical protein
MAYLLVNENDKLNVVKKRYHKFQKYSLNAVVIKEIVAILSY